MNSKLFRISFILCIISNCNCNEELISCPDCESPAFKISIIDTSGNKSGGFTIKLLDKSNTVTIVDDTSHNSIFFDTSYSIFIKSGTYHIEIAKSGYDTILLNNISVTENRCGITNTREFTIKPEYKGLAKSKDAGFQIIKDTIRLGCGS